jgi:hypothetical protein
MLTPSRFEGVILVMISAVAVAASFSDRRVLLFVFLLFAKELE